MKDRLPPHAPESEQCVIGCCLLEPNKCMSESQMVIKSRDYFYTVASQMVWDVMCSMRADEINLVTVLQRITDDSRMEKGAALEFLSRCQDIVTSSANLVTWIREVEQKYILRSVIATCTDAIAMAYEHEDATTVLDSVESRVLQIRPSAHSSRSIKQLFNDSLGLIEARSQNWDMITGYSTGLPDLDKITDGIHGGEFIVIGAPTSCGKTALALNIVVHNALAKTPSAILSAEMQPVKLAIRTICSEARSNFRKMAEPDIVRMIHSARQISKSPIYIENINGFTIGQTRALARRLKQKFGIKIMVIENIQLLTGSGDNREQQIADISRGMKGIALELDMAVLGLSQLNDDDRLRESRAIGHDADSVWILKNKGDWKPDIQPVNLQVEKCRDGETGKIELLFYKTHTRFESASKFPDVQ